MEGAVRSPQIFNFVVYENKVIWCIFDIILSNLVGF